MAVANLQRLSSQAHRLPSLSFFSKSLIYRRTSSSTKKVADRIVRLSAIDFVGKKHEVVGLAGQTLLKALINTGLVDPESHRLEEIDACAAHCEVNIAQEWLDKLPPRSYDEEYVLVRNSRARALNKHSRLGCQVLLDHDLEGFDDQVDSGQCKAGVQEPILKEYWALQVFSQCRNLGMYY
ncbi:hypothetical protein JHK87_050195 [Glycine soja]|nr:hypothetical protein JHK87_050195 [Glycine soja]